MNIKTIIDEDFTNYKKPSMVIGFPYCTFKCEKECGMQVCQNSTLATSPNIEVDLDSIVVRYLNNSITSAIVMAGLEPFDSYKDLYELVYKFRTKTDDDIVVFTGYNRAEVENKVKELSAFKNIIIKFGRFIPNAKSRYDDVLGINLVSDNQYGEVIS